MQSALCVKAGALSFSCSQIHTIIMSTQRVIRNIFANHSPKCAPHEPSTTCLICLNESTFKLEGNSSAVTLFQQDSSSALQSWGLPKRINTLEASSITEESFSLNPSQNISNLLQPYFEWRIVCEFIQEIMQCNESFSEVVSQQRSIGSAWQGCIGEHLSCMYWTANVVGK